MNQPLLAALLPCGDAPSTARSCMDLLERGIAKLEAQARARAIARAEMRRAIAAGAERRNPVLLNPPKHLGSHRPKRERNKPCSPSLTSAEAEHAERLHSEGYSISKIAWMLGRTQIRIEEALRERRKERRKSA